MHEADLGWIPSSHMLSPNQPEITLSAEPGVSPEHHQSDQKRKKEKKKKTKKKKKSDISGKVRVHQESYHEKFVNSFTIAILLYQQLQFM